MKNIVIALALTILITVASDFLFDYTMGGFAILLVYFILYGAAAYLSTSDEEDQFPGDAPVDRSEWPLPGPFRNLGTRMGTLMFMIVFWPTHLLSFLNPFQLKQMVRQIIGNYRLTVREDKSGNHGADYQLKADYQLPFDGEWLVYNGGVTPKTSHSWDILGQRFALDFVQADGHFSRHSGSGTRHEDYYCYGRPILAAADGEVVQIEDRIGDAPWVGYGFCDFLARSFIGNYVMIRHAEGEYGLYAHLIQGSVEVQPSDSVEAGDQIGQCGHSGHSSEPHLHFHLQDSPDFFEGMGLPVRFRSIEIDGRTVEGASVQAGQRVRNTPSSDKTASAVHSELKKHPGQ